MFLVSLNWYKLLEPCIQTPARMVHKHIDPPYFRLLVIIPKKYTKRTQTIYLYLYKRESKETTHD